MVKYGIALDLGTSGFRSHLVDLENNAKIIETAVTVRHPIPGANIMDHLHFWLTSGSEIGHKIIMQTVRNLIALYGEDKLAKIEKMAICGNPIQLSLFENIEVRDLAYAGKNKLKTLGIEKVKRGGHITTAGKVGMIDFNPEMEIIIPPAIEHEIGADALAMIIKSDLLNKKQTCMVTDYGTNAEMGLYHDGELYSGSAAAGPAMEGQSIESGMLASPHAISDMDLADDGYWINQVLDDRMIPVAVSKVEPLTGQEVKILDYEAKGITGTGVVSAVALGLESDIIRLPKINTHDGILRLANGIKFTTNDVQEAGKAMGAIRAGHRTLIHDVGIKDEDVKVMYMSGASGTYVDPIKAQKCGMIPRVLDEVYQLGNTSLMIAHDLLKKDDTLDEMQSIADSIQANHIMFATSPTFEKMYVLELAYWTEGMSLDMYDVMLQLDGFDSFPELRIPKKSVRMVKSDIPEMGAGLNVLEKVGMKMYGNFKGCTGCKKCEKGCPEDALTVTGKEICVRSDLCLGTACKQCETNCPERVYHFTELKVEM